MSAEAADLITGLLQPDEKDRLGTTGFRPIQNHPWFARFDWVALLRHELTPPYIPPAGCALPAGRVAASFAPVGVGVDGRARFLPLGRASGRSSEDSEALLPERAGALAACGWGCSCAEGDSCPPDASAAPAAAAPAGSRPGLPAVVEGAVVLAGGGGDAAGSSAAAPSGGRAGLAAALARPAAGRKVDKLWGRDRD
jgi:hypothetical protein